MIFLCFAGLCGLPLTYHICYFKATTRSWSIIHRCCRSTFTALNRLASCIQGNIFLCVSSSLCSFLPLCDANSHHRLIITTYVISVELIGLSNNLPILNSTIVTEKGALLSDGNIPPCLGKVFFRKLQQSSGIYLLLYIK